MSIESNMTSAAHLRRFRMRTILQLAVLSPVVLTAAACDDGEGEGTGESDSGEAQIVVAEPTPAVQFRSSVPDAIELARPVSLLELPEGSDYRGVEARLRTIGARVLQSWNGRLVAAELPEGAAEVLRQAGVVGQYEGYVEPSAIGIADLPAQRFVAVYNSLYHSGDHAPAAIAHVDRVEAEGEAFELNEVEVEELGAQLRGAARGTTSDDGEYNTLVPYASGTVVVAVFLPESNGNAEPSTEDWTEEAIHTAYDKIQRGLDLIARADENSDLRIVVHYESVPAPGQLEGTIDCDYETGKHVNFNSGGNPGLVMANIMSNVLGREIDEFGVWPAYREYLNNLREQYNADGAFITIVPRNGNGSAGIRAHAFRNGPYTAINDTTRWQTYAHEFGHIFGASDEYCPDACRSPVEITGYQAMFNGNAVGRAHAEGVDRGHGEGRVSLMRYNATEAINGYARGAWGWLDHDGDGLLDVRDTIPTTALEARVEGRTLHLAGLIEDQPESGWHHDLRAPFSSNRIAALRYRIGGEGQPWLELALDGRTRGRLSIDRAITDLPLGEVLVDVAAVNDAGGVQTKPQRFQLRVSDDQTAALPSLSLAASTEVASVGESLSVTATGFDPDGGALSIAFDLDGDGSFEHSGAEASVDFATPGIHRVAARATNAAGQEATADVEIHVLDAARGPEFSVRGPGSVVFGEAQPTLSFSAESEARDLAYNWVVERLAPGAPLRYETGFVAGQSNFAHQLEATPVIANDKVSVFGDGYRDTDVRNDSVKIGAGLFAHAAGDRGLIITRYPEGVESELVAELHLGGHARSLLLDGDTLFAVVDEQLKVVDISDITAPQLIEQAAGEQQIVNLEDNQFLSIPEDGVISHKLPLAPQLSLDSIQVRFVLDHPDPSQLVVELLPPRESNLEPLVLLDNQTGLATRDQYYFTSHTDPRLAEYVGAAAGGAWQLLVRDTENDAVVGTLEYSQIVVTGTPAGDGLHIGRGRLKTMIGGHTLLISDFDGARAVDVRDLSALQDLGTFEQDLLADILPLDDTRAMISFTRIDGRTPKAFAMALDCQPGQLPTAGGVEQRIHMIPFFVRVGDYIYSGGLTEEGLPSGDVVVLDLPGFAAGGDLTLSRQQGEVPTNSGVLVGDTYWVTASGVGPEEWDLSDPLLPRRIRSHAGPKIGIGTAIDRIGDTKILAVGNSEAAILDVAAREHNLSDMYEVTVQARDSQGLVSEAHRYVHHNPYNHAPIAAGMHREAGSTIFDTWLFRVSTQDVDHGQTWDPTIFVRVDIDGDGAYDTRWYTGFEDLGVELPLNFTEAGSHLLRVQVRDGYWATHEFTFPVDVGNGSDCTLEGNECGSQAYCWFDEAAACGDSGTGTCIAWGSECTLPDEGEVCGCDGRTYLNACDAQQSTASIASQGACPDIVCGGPNNLGCPEDFYCDRAEPDVCGEEQTEGVCKASDRICLWLPGQEVCGCDGQTYNSECDAHKAGTAVASEGICADDCRVAGCEDGAECSYCFGGYACIPSGAHC